MDNIKKVNGIVDINKTEINSTPLEEKKKELKNKDASAEFNNN